LINKKGNIIERFAPEVHPDSFAKRLEELIVMNSWSKEWKRSLLEDYNYDFNENHSEDYFHNKNYVNLNRVRILKKVTKKKKGPVIYLMNRDHRVEDNWALLYAQMKAE
jgi:hypothetical protein